MLLCRSFRQISSLYFITCFVFAALFYHSRKKRKDSLETRAELAVFFSLTWVPKIIRTQSTRACMKYKQKSARNHITV